MPAGLFFHSYKYSHRNSDESWTAARLCETPKGKRPRSIIARFAQIFTDPYDKYPRTVVIERFRIKLVCNRPLDTGFAASLKIDSDWLERIDPNTPITSVQLIQGIVEGLWEDLAKEKAKRERLIKNVKEDIQRFE